LRAATNIAATYNPFHVVKRDGKWRVEDPKSRIFVLHRTAPSFFAAVPIDEANGVVDFV